MGEKRIIATITREREPDAPWKTAAEATECCCENSEAIPCEESAEYWYGYSVDEILDAAGIHVDAGGYDSEGHKVSVRSVRSTNAPCGKVITRWDKCRNCCDEATGIEWDYDNSASVISRNSYGVISVNGGKRPLEISVRGDGFWLDEAHTFRDGTTFSSLFRVFTDDTACGSCAITVEDGCSSTSENVRSANGEWVRIRITAHNFPYYNPDHDPESSTSTSCNYGLAGKYADWRYPTAIKGKYKTRVYSCMVGRKATGGTDFFSEKCTARPISTCVPYLSGTCNLSSYKPIPDDGVYGGEPAEEWRPCLADVYNTQYCTFDHYFPVMKIETWEWVC